MSKLFDQLHSQQVQSSNSLFDKLHSEQSNVPSQEDPGMLTSLGRGAVQGATMGLSDEIAGAMKNPIGAAKELATYLGSNVDENSPDVQAYTKERDESRALNKQAEEANPMTYMGGNLLSSILPGGAIAKGVGLGAKAALGMRTIAPALARAAAPVAQGLAGEGATVGQLASAGAATGALEGVGQSIGNSDSNKISIGDTVENAILGGGLGGAGGVAIAGARKLGNVISDSDIGKQFKRSLSTGEDLYNKKQSQSLANNLETQPSKIINQYDTALNNIENEKTQLLNNMPELEKAIGIDEVKNAVNKLTDIGDYRTLSLDEGAALKQIFGGVEKVASDTGTSTVKIPGINDKLDSIMSQNIPNKVKTNQIKEVLQSLKSDEAYGAEVPGAIGDNQYTILVNKLNRIFDTSLENAIPELKPLNNSQANLLSQLETLTGKRSTWLNPKQKAAAEKALRNKFKEGQLGMRSDELRTVDDLAKNSNTDMSGILGETSKMKDQLGELIRRGDNSIKPEYSSQLRSLGFLQGVSSKVGSHIYENPKFYNALGKVQEGVGSVLAPSKAGLDDLIATGTIQGKSPTLDKLLDVVKAPDTSEARRRATQNILLNNPVVRQMLKDKEDSTK